MLQSLNLSRAVRPFFMVSDGILSHSAQEHRSLNSVYMWGPSMSVTLWQGSMWRTLSKTDVDMLAFFELQQMH